MIPGWGSSGNINDSPQVNRGHSKSALGTRARSSSTPVQQYRQVAPRRLFETWNLNTGGNDDLKPLKSKWKNMKKLATH